MTKNEALAATPHPELIAELMNPNNPKNEREHAAVREIERLRETRQAIIAGALYDFMGWLTTRKERIVLSAADEALPAVDAIKDFAKMRGLSLDDAKVQDWIDALPQQQAEPVRWDKTSASFDEWWDSDRYDGGNPFDTDSFAYWAWEGWQAALAQRPWAGLTDEEIENAISDGFARGLDDGNVPNKIVINYVRVIEATLKERNHD